ncbi:MAG: hypothetical protein SCARUB_04733 [Candidatus Scalindua rubra]|uniref:Flagellar FliJ protein n=1 Tax=Candidatus Scalindua rubra TaxID=1872076 RepID=A0A1E3X5B8_9BACT|nr:MAG: hypothetical protein SCARUB_04733 [Candidatus Scalindua rubra]
MRKFHFKLQPLLNKERIYENECIGRLRVIQDEMLKKEDRLKNLKERKIKCQNGLKTKKQRHVTSEELKIYEEYFVKLGNEIDTGSLELQEIAKELRTVQEELAKIIKKRKALEKLRERWEEEYRSDWVLSLNKEMDDIAMKKFINKLATNGS